MIKYWFFLCWLYIFEKDFNDLGEYLKIGNRKFGVCFFIYNFYYVEFYSLLFVLFLLLVWLWKFLFFCYWLFYVDGKCLEKNRNINVYEFISWGSCVCVINGSLFIKFVNLLVVKISRVGVFLIVNYDSFWFKCIFLFWGLWNR